MTQLPIIDAGPGLNFLSIGKERILIEALGALSTPEAVRDEMLRKARHDRRFRRVLTTWPKLTARWVEVLSDSQTPELAAVVRRITQLPMAQRMKTSKDLGEIMVVAHAVVAAEAGREVIVLIDDSGGARIATKECARLDRLRASGRSVGTIKLVDTRTVLELQAGRLIADRGEMRTIYNQMRGLDDGLPPIEGTGLLTSKRWSR